jgi:predicted dienelactone hydrolase
MKLYRCFAVTIAAATLCAVVSAPARAADPLATCLKVSGAIGSKCLTKGNKVLFEQVEPVDGLLDDLTAGTQLKLAKKCNTDRAITLGYRDFFDMADRVNDGCNLFAYEMNALVYTPDQAGLTESQVACRAQMSKWLSKLQKIVTKMWGKKCTAGEYLGKVCDRAKRDAVISKMRAKGEKALTAKCGADFDAVNMFDGATLDERIASFVEIGIVRGRHWAERVYPPNNMGPSADLGPFQVGVTTLNLEDPARMNVPMDGLRPVLTEVYYPTTDADIVGVPQEAIEVLGFSLFSIPAYRDVALAGSSHPVVLFSHGNNGIRTQSFFFAQQLASHGFIVLSPDHHGNTFPDTLDSIVDPAPEVNRPLDMSFIIDELEAINVDVGNFFEGAFDLTKIGASGHSFGGYTTFALGGPDFGLGPFTDARVKALFPQAPASSAGFFDPAFFAAITVPTLIIGGTIDETTPFDPHQQYAFDNMVPGASVVGLAEIINGGHFTFSSFCEVPATLLAFLGGFEEACEARHIPWRHAQDVTMYLAHNFFDGTINGNAAALARLDPLVVADFDAEDIVYQSK